MIGPVSYPDVPPEPAPPLPVPPPSAGSAYPFAGRYSARHQRGVLGTVVAAVIAAIVVGASGFPLGWLWAQLAPRVAIIKVEAGFIYADAEPEEAVAADGWFVILGAGAGVVFAVLAWTLLRRQRGIAVMVGLALGSLLAATVAWWLGRRIGLSEFEAAQAAAKVGDHLQAPLRLRTTALDPDPWWLPEPTGVAAVQALVAVFIYTCFAGFSSYANLRGPDPQGYPYWPEADPNRPPPPPPGPEDAPTQILEGPLPDFAPPFDWDQVGPGRASGGQPGPGRAPGDEPGPGRAPGDEPGPGRAPGAVAGFEGTPGGQLGPGRTGSSDNATGTART
jgi:hypothetical protein